MRKRSIRIPECDVHQKLHEQTGIPPDETQSIRTHYVNDRHANGWVVCSRSREEKVETEDIRAWLETYVPEGWRFCHFDPGSRRLKMRKVSTLVPRVMFFTLAVIMTGGLLYAIAT